MSTNSHSFSTLDFIMAYENGECTALEILEGFGSLIRSGTVWSLQGSYGRTARDLIERGLIDPDSGNITDEAVALLANIPEDD